MWLNSKQRENLTELDIWVKRGDPVAERSPLGGAAVVSSCREMLG